MSRANVNCNDALIPLYKCVLHEFALRLRPAAAVLFLSLCSWSWLRWTKRGCCSNISYIARAAFTCVPCIFFFSVWHSCPLHRSIYSIYCCALTHICANSFFWHNSMRTVANMRSNRMHSTPYKSQYNAHFHRRRRESLRWRTINLDHGEETP